MEAEIRLPHLSAKEWPGLLATPEAKREVRGAFFRVLGGQRESELGPAGILSSDFQLPGLRGNKFQLL